MEGDGGNEGVRGGSEGDGQWRSRKEEGGRSDDEEDIRTSR